jgi:hypothetical protein
VETEIQKSMMARKEKVLAREERETETTLENAADLLPGRQWVTVQQTGTAPDGHAQDQADQFPAGAQVFVREDVRLVRNSVRTDR